MTTSPHSAQAINAARAEAETRRIRSLVRPEGHQFTRGEIGAMKPDEFEANEPEIVRQMSEGTIKP